MTEIEQQKSNVKKLNHKNFEMKNSGEGGWGDGTAILCEAKPFQTKASPSSSVHSFLKF